jgi:hypothetical protein
MLSKLWELFLLFVDNGACFTFVAGQLFLIHSPFVLAPVIGYAYAVDYMRVFSYWLLVSRLSGLV